MHQAMARVRLSLEGYPNQSCAAYLLVTRKAEETRIHIAFYLTASNRVLIYVPVRRPETPEAIGQTLKEAHRFLQVVGIDLEPFPLPKDRKKQIETLAEVPVLFAGSEESR